MISGVSRSLKILDALSRAPAGLTVSQLVSALKIEKSVVSRILTTLEADHYIVCESSTNAYRLGLKFVALGLRQLEESGIYTLCMPKLRELAEQVGELVQLALVDGEGMTYVAKVDGKERIRVHSLLGQRVPLHASTAGKLWLASLPEDTALRIVLNAGLPGYTPRTITRVDDLRAELRMVRARGYAFVNEELIPGANAVGVPIQSERTGRVIGALLVTAPSFRLPLKRAQEVLPALRRSAHDLQAIGEITLEEAVEETVPWRTRQQERKRLSRRTKLRSAINRSATYADT